MSFRVDAKMGVKGGKPAEQQAKWNKFKQKLIKEAGLPTTCLVRLSFTNPEGHKSEIANYDDLKRLAKKYGQKHNNTHLRLSIVIEVLAKSFQEYQRRFEYEKAKYLKKNNDKINDLLTKQQLLQKFRLLPLVSTNAIVQKSLKLLSQEPPQLHSQSSASSSISIMDMLNIADNNNGNAKVVKKEELNDKDRVITDLMDNVVNVQKPDDNNNNNNSKQAPKLHPKTSPASADIYKQDNANANASDAIQVVKNNNNDNSKIKKGKAKASSPALSSSISQSQHVHSKKLLSTIFKDPLVSFEEMRHKHYIKSEKYPLIGKLDEIEQKELDIESIDGNSEDSDDDSDDSNDSNDEEYDIKKLTVNGWPSSMNTAQLQTWFSPYGEVNDAFINDDCAFVIYDDENSALRAQQALNGFELGEYKLSVTFTKIMKKKNNKHKEVVIEGSKRIIIGNWPLQIGNKLLKTICSPYGSVVSCEIVNECGIVEYSTCDEAAKALKTLHGFKLGQITLTATFADNVSHIVSMNNNNNGNDVNVSDDDDAMEQVVVVTSVKENENVSSIFEQDNCPDLEAIDADISPEQNDELLQALNDDNDDYIGNAEMEHTPNETELDHMVNHEEGSVDDNDEPFDKSKMSNNSEFVDQNIDDIVNGIDGIDGDDDDVNVNDMNLNNINPNDLSMDIKEETRPVQMDMGNRKHSKKHSKNKKSHETSDSDDDASESSDSSSSSFTSSSDSESDSSMDSDGGKKKKKKHKHKSLSKKLKNKNLSKKEKRRLKRKLKRKKRKRKAKRKRHASEAHIDALTDCLSKFTSLMSSVSQSAMVMQQSVAAMSQLHAQQAQNSMLYTNPIFASKMLSNNNNVSNNVQDPSESRLMTAIATQMTQGGPNNDNNNNNNDLNAVRPVNTTALQGMIKVIHQSPILHSMSPMNSMRSAENQSNSINMMNLSGQSDPEGNVNSKSRILEHKKELQNVSPEMEQKLTLLKGMGYTNRTFNLVLLKQENGDVDKVVANLKQFYQN